MTIIKHEIDKKNNKYWGSRWSRFSSCFREQIIFILFTWNINYAKWMWHSFSFARHFCIHFELGSHILDKHKFYGISIAYSYSRLFSNVWYLRVRRHRSTFTIYCGKFRYCLALSKSPYLDRNINGNRLFVSNRYQLIEILLEKVIINFKDR